MGRARSLVRMMLELATTDSVPGAGCWLPTGEIGRSVYRKRASEKHLSRKNWAIVLLVLAMHSVILQPIGVHAAGSSNEGVAEANGSGRSLQTLDVPLQLLGNITTDIANRIVEDIQNKRVRKRVVPKSTPLPLTSSAAPLIISTAPLVTTIQPLSSTPFVTSTLPSTTQLVPSSTPGVTSTPTASSTLAPTTSVMPTTLLPATSSLTPTTSMAPTSTPTVTSTAPVATSSAPPTSTATPGPCANAVSLTFSNTTFDPVGMQGPLFFPDWFYDAVVPSNPSTYPQAIIYESNTQIINVTDARGILLCGIAASGFTRPTNATFQGTTLGGQTVTQTQAISVVWPTYQNVTFDSTWQPLSSIAIVTSGDPNRYSVDLWEISYVLLGSGTG